MTYLYATYDPWLVTVSLLIAGFASYVALDLAKRVRTHGDRLAPRWWLGGSLAMGTGIWCTHFVGMLAFTLSTPLGFGHGLTITSWVAAVAVSGVALYIASQAELAWRSLAIGALAMGLGICAMHYIGMAAMDMAPGIVWDPTLVLVSAGIAVAASAAALLMFFWLRLASRNTVTYQVLAALVMGVAICGMHYTGMAAASFPAGSVCLSAGALAGDNLVSLVTVSSVALLAMVLVTSVVDARMQSRTEQLAGSLKTANEQLMSANETLRQRAFVDALTNLPNRLLFEDRLSHALLRCERSAGRTHHRDTVRLAVLFVDLDGFKPVNDSLGHAAGDQVLKEAAARLRRTARDSDTVARIGGDEFVLLLEDVAGPVDCATLARRLVSAMAEPFELGDRAVEVSASIGVVVYPDHGHQDKLLAHADAAMYAAKRAGGNSYAMFEAHMDADALQQLSLQTELRRAVERDQLQLVYQPKIEGRGGQISGVEALLRWNHPERGLLAPGHFIPLAERFGLIGSLGNWVIEEACRQMRAWSDTGVTMCVSINLSVHQLRENDLVERIGKALERHGVDPSHLLCEITETVAMDDIRATQQALEGLARIGVFLSIDDFGTGYSSLSYLRQLPATQLKIDRSFVADLETSADARAIVSAVIQLAHALSLRVVAEGVETEGQQDVLVDLGCDELQGYYFARPMAADKLLTWLGKHRPKGAAERARSVAAAET
jgi:diguanylate cyclase